MSYTIITDSSCDIDINTLQQWQVKCAHLIYRFDGEEREYRNYDMTAAEFYQRMRDGAVVKTAAANSATFTEIFEPELAQGQDILYIGFSSGLSTTFNSGRMAAGELAEKYPERRIRVVDTLGASAGQGLIVYYAAQLRDQGVELDEAARITEENSRHMCHWFTVDDMEYLKRGGRISAAAAFAAGVMNIKPVMHMDDAGHLVNVSKVRGRRQALRALAGRFNELALDKDEIFFICHSDCMDDVRELEALMGRPAAYIADIGAVIGAHCGPGTISLFFLGRER